MNTTTGTLELTKSGEGRLRKLSSSFQPSPEDPVVPAKLVQRYGLHPGVELEVELGPPSGGENGSGKKGRENGSRGRKKKSKSAATAIAPTAPRVAAVLGVEGMDPSGYGDRLTYDQLTTITPSRG